MKRNAFYQRKVILLNIFIAVLIFFYLYKLSKGKTERHLILNNRIYISTDASTHVVANLTITNRNTFLFPGGHTKLKFGNSEAFLLQNMCTEVSDNRQRYLTFYDTSFDYLFNFNGINVSLKRNTSDGHTFTHHKAFNMFFVKGTEFITFPTNMHHFYKDLAVDLFSVLRRLPHSKKTTNW